MGFHKCFLYSTNNYFFSGKHNVQSSTKIKILRTNINKTMPYWVRFD